MHRAIPARCTNDDASAPARGRTHQGLFVSLHAGRGRAYSRHPGFTAAIVAQHLGWREYALPRRVGDRSSIRSFGRNGLRGCLDRYRRCGLRRGARVLLGVGVHLGLALGVGRDVDLDRRPQIVGEADVHAVDVDAAGAADRSSRPPLTIASWAPRDERGTSGGRYATLSENRPRRPVTSCAPINGRPADVSVARGWEPRRLDLGRDVYSLSLRPLAGRDESLHRRPSVKEHT